MLLTLMTSLHRAPQGDATTMDERSFSSPAHKSHGRFRHCDGTKGAVALR